VREQPALGHQLSIEHDREHPAVLHRLQRVGAQVHRHLVQLGRVAHRRRIARIEPLLQAHLRQKRRGENLQGLLHHRLHVHRHALAKATAAEGEDALHQPLAARPRLHHLIDVAAHRAAFQVLLRQLPVTQDRPQDVIEVVRDPPRQPPDRLHLRRLLQLPLHLSSRSRSRARCASSARLRFVMSR